MSVLFILQQSVVVPSRAVSHSALVVLTQFTSSFCWLMPLEWTMGCIPM